MHLHAQTDLDFPRLLQCMAVPMMVLDRELKFVFVTEPYCKSVKRTAEQLLGEYVFDAFPDTPERIAVVKAQFVSTLQGKTTHLTEQPYRLETEPGKWETRIWKAMQIPYYDESGKITHMVQRAENVTEQVTLREQNEIISAELDHRVRNMLAVLESISMLTAASSQTVDEFTDAFSGRLASMTRNFSQLSRAKWTPLPLKTILVSEISQFVPIESSRVVLEGDEAALSVNSTKDLSLIIHELATNAAKYGCFSTPEGRLRVTWTVTDDMLEINWVETGLAGIKPPTREGFGSQILSVMAHVKSHRAFRNEGLNARLSIPIESLENGIQFNRHGAH